MRSAAPVLTLLLLLLLGCGAQDPRTHSLQADLARLTREIKLSESRLASARTEQAQLDIQLETSMTRITDKLRRRVEGNDQLYLELDLDQVGGLVRAFLEGHVGSGTLAGQPYSYTLKNVRTRSHRERFFVHASATTTLGGARCEGPITGYLLHLDRELLRLQELQLTCATAQNKLDLNLSAQLPPIPLPFAFVRKLEFQPDSTVSRKATGLELITPVQATITAERLVLKAGTVSWREVKP